MVGEKLILLQKQKTGQSLQKTTSQSLLMFCSHQTIGKKLNKSIFQSTTQSVQTK